MSSPLRDAAAPADCGEFARLVREMIDAAETGLALYDREAAPPLAANRRMREWFAESSLAEIVGDAAPLAALRDGETREAAREIRIGRRAVALSLAASARQSEGRRLFALEARNVSKLKELEYMMESYAKMLERSERELRREKERAEKLLLNIMPKMIYDEIRDVGVSAPQRYDECSVLMLDFVGFTEMSIAQDPAVVVAELNDIFTAFDRIAEQYGCERIKTIGDAYIAVSGLPEPAPDHAANIARVALRMLRYLERRNEGREIQWKARIGINSGPVVGSMIGVQKFVYDIFGPGVNLAARLEARAGPMEVTLSGDMAKRLADKFALVEAGEAELKGFGMTRLFKLTGELQGG